MRPRQIVTPFLWIMHGRGFMSRDSLSHIAPLDAVAIDIRYAAGATATWPLAWLALRLRKRRIESNRRAATRCVRCGYDLRAIPDCCP